MSTSVTSPNLYAVVDMGSNGIRFSITDLSPPTARIMTTVYQDRAAISLYDAQYRSEGQGPSTKSPIPSDIIDAVLGKFKRFKRTCQDFHVPPENIRVIATEATREAVNSAEFRAQILKATGWQVEMLSKEDEGRVGAAGIASSSHGMQGLAVDLGGGSMQMTWVDVYEEVKKDALQSVSLPYGAAALSRRLSAAAQQGGEKALEQLTEEVRSRLFEASQSLSVPPRFRAGISEKSKANDLQDHSTEHDDFRLYLSGGGFRGWGYVLMSEHAVQPYPIPLINGFTIEAAAFLNTAAVQASVAQKYTASDTGLRTQGEEDDEKSKDADKEQGIFRISERRADQIPAVAFLISNLVQVLPHINQVQFCQGGVREGILYKSLPQHIQDAVPLTVVTRPFAPLVGTQQTICKLLLDSHPHMYTDTTQPILAAFPPHLHLALVDTMYIHRGLPKETQAAAALRSTTTGVLAQAYGVSHVERAMLALMLCERWGGEAALSPVDAPYFALLRRLVGCHVAWWCMYTGRVAKLAGELWPAGIVDGDSPERVDVQSEFKMHKKAEHLHLTLQFRNGVDMEACAKAVAAIEQAGKKKHWVKDGADVYGVKVDITCSARS